MTFDNTQPQSDDALSLTELDLYHLIMDYRDSQGLAPIPLSLGLTTTAGRHVADTLYNIWDAGLDLPDGANLHSWSDAPYYSDHSEADVMWDAPQRIGTSYTGSGFEISAAGYSSIEAALIGWQNSSGHDAVMVNEGIWANMDWNAIGIGVSFDPDVSTYGGRVFHVWFGREADPDGAPILHGTGGADEITGTDFADEILARNGRDDLSGGKGNDMIRAGGGRDDVTGGQGRDALFGDNGGDTLNGQNGRDKINGGAGNDALSGGAGRDLFVFNGRDFGTDTITDYDNDRIRIRSADEAETRPELNAALRESRGDVIYDHLRDGKNVIVFEDTRLADLDLGLFQLG